ncbi:hypothetical protein VSH64_34440 [Amycolatopsis rhabdoformis]|uniref:Uncharacterized protein n=1 Tax=Amycolatopsis rhabdoformis TaxID=1448059 RepID=A0ABZ1I278_9PSEU|nr:hypothetical protein [Amycolatopsis rhabdoformis]WSE27918.1 hypothetical protein VSH64_34440 [Amycolatopsis rhabdoformis]
MTNPHPLTSLFSPDAAAHSAKNAPAAPGPTNQPADRLERNTMVGSTSTAAWTPYKALADLMAAKPTSSTNYSSQAEFIAARVSWLFELADALTDANLDDDADSTRSTALDLVRDAVSEVAGGVA